MPDPRDVSVHEMLVNIICALVDRPDDVHVDTVATGAGSAFNIRVHPTDTGKVIGSQGSNIRSIRTVLNASGRKRERTYAIAVEDVTP